MWLNLGKPHWWLVSIKFELFAMIYQLKFSWWRHQTEAFSTLLALCEGNIPVTGRLPSQRPVTRSFAVFFDLRLNKRLSKQSRRLWFEAPSRLLWHHCKVINVTGQHTGSGHFAPKDGCSANIWEKIPIFFQNLLNRFISMISYILLHKDLYIIKFEVCLVMNQFQRVVFIGYYDMNLDS